MRNTKDFWEVSKDRLTFYETIGEGRFGKVHRGVFLLSYNIMNNSWLGFWNLCFITSIENDRIILTRFNSALTNFGKEVGFHFSTQS